MNGFTIKLDRSIFSDEVVARAAHRYTAQLQVSMRLEGTDILVVLTPMDKGGMPADVAERFQNDVLDEKLRELIRAETHQIHHQLIAAALREATPRGVGA